MTFSILSIIDIQQNLYGCFAASKPIFSKDDKNIEKNTETFLLFLFLLWQCCDLIMNISYQCLEFITAKFHLMNFLCVIKHWPKLTKFACNQQWKLTDGRCEHPAGSSWQFSHWQNGSSFRRRKWGSKSHQVKMGGMEKLCGDLKVGQETMQGLKKENFSLRGWRAKVWMNFVWYFYNLIFF